MNSNQELIEFVNVGARDTRVKGAKRLLIITHEPDVTRLEIRGEAIEGTDLFTVSDTSVPTAVFQQHRELILSSAKA